MRIITILILIFLFSIPLHAEAGHRFPPNQEFPTTFIQLNVVDENGQFIDSLINVRGFYDNTLIYDYSLTVLFPNQNLTVPWSKNYLPPGTEIELIATSEGYKNSESFLFKVTEDTPTDGLLFEHTFVLFSLVI